jgi:hypothetical protein
MPSTSLSMDLGPRFIAAFYAPTGAPPDVGVHLPVCLHIGSESIVLGSLADLAHLRAIKRRHLLVQGVTGLRGRTVATELPRRGRFRQWLAIDHLGPAGAPDAERAVLYCAGAPAAPAIEMIDWQSRCPQLSTFLADMRRAS